MKPLFTLLLISFALAATASAQSSTSILRGIGPIAVVIQDLDPEATREEFTVDLIRTDVEVELRKAGIRVVNRDALDDNSGRPYLFITVNTARGALSVYAYSIEMRFQQNATLTRNPDVTLSVSTWNRSVVGTERGTRLPMLREKIKEMTMAYINEYLAANPK